MFFIMGTSSKVVQIGSAGGLFCPHCGGSAAFSLCKCYDYVHLFFLPIFRFHVQYIATCPGCASVYEVEKEAGRAVERGERSTLSPGELTLLRTDSASVCPRCGGRNPQGSAFCNHCGGRL